jgi:hypothetical protein
LQNLRDDVEIEKYFVYKMPPEVRAKFAKTADISFDVEKEYKYAIAHILRPKVILEKSIDQHANMCLENADAIVEAKQLAKLLNEDIESRIRHFCNCLNNATKNYRDWLIEDYKIKLILAIGKKHREQVFAADEE